MNTYRKNLLLVEIKSIYKSLEDMPNEDRLIKLNDVRAKFKEDLSPGRYAFYSETLDGIILALTQFSAEKDKSTQEQIVALIKDLIKYILVELMNEKEIKKDIVFLPYKASMWDSLETIWEAAYEDKEHCNAYVVPLPYAERNPDQTVAKWHYEIDQFPKNVPVINWQQIDLEKMHPDIIFIHNPYDNCNALTSVGSEYYSSELKKHTDKLVYVPYYVTREIKPGDELLEENIAHLITTLGVLNSDLVVVQSENIRQVYINVLIRHTNQKDRKYWEERIVGLGSPKYDKVLTVRKEDVEIPKEWLKVIKKSNKKWKKIVFYNTGLTPVMNGKEESIKKIEDIIQLFKKYKDDIALIWRPHPLVSAMMVGVLPELQQRYETIVKTYKEEGWGIYDDTADLNRAMTLSDAYYGDGSSVVLLYQNTGKPILYNNLLIGKDCYVENPDKTTIGELDLFKICHAYYEEKNIWVTALHDPYLYKIDIENKIIEQVALILDEDELQSYIFILSYKDYFIFVPSSNNIIILMDRNTFHKERYTMPLQNIIMGKFGFYFVNGFVHNDDLYLFGVAFAGIIKFDLINKQFKVIDGFLSDLQIKFFNDGLFIFNYIPVEGKLFMPFSNSNAVLEFSPNDDNTIIHYVGDDKQRYISGIWDDQNIWLTPRDVKNGNFVKWNPKDNSIKLYDYPEELKSLFKGDFAYTLGDSFKAKDSIFMLSRTFKIEGNSNIKINTKTDKVESFDDFYKLDIFLGLKYCGVNFKNNILSFIDGLNIVNYNFETDEIKIIEITPTEGALQHIKQSKENKINFIFKPNVDGISSILAEYKNLNLYNLIKYLKSI